MWHLEIKNDELRSEGKEKKKEYIKVKELEGWDT